MELSNSKIKESLIFSQKKPPHFSTLALKNKKKSTPKKFLILYFRKFLALTLKRFRKRKPRKKFLIFQEI